jgi:glycosyltransferase involved in cell wall biosynthesis
MGVPVVVSEEAAGGVDAVPNEHLLTANSPSEWVGAIRRLLDDPREREKFSAAGRARVLSNHSWKYSMGVLDTLIEDCLGRVHSG